MFCFEYFLKIFLDGIPTSSSTFNTSVAKEFSNDGHCIFVTFYFGGLTLVLMYKSPKLSKNNFKQTLVRVMEGKSNAVFIGDINIDLMKEENVDIIKLFENRGFYSQLNLQERSTNYNTHIDVCFSDRSDVMSWFYEYYIATIATTNQYVLSVLKCKLKFSVMG